MLSAKSHPKDVRNMTLYEVFRDAEADYARYLSLKTEPDEQAVDDEPSWTMALDLIRKHPELWFRDYLVDDRDHALIHGALPSWVDLGPNSYLKHVHHKVRTEEEIKRTMWIVENDEACRLMTAHGGAAFHGFQAPFGPAVDWQHQKVNVNIRGNIAPNVSWGLMSGKPSKLRIYAGPCSICPKHPWDAMILRDAATSTSGIGDIESIASRKFDILLIKMCEEYDHPWLVVAVKDSGERVQETCCLGL